MKQFTDSLTLGEYAYSFASEEINLTYLYGFATSLTWTDNTPAAFELATTDVTVSTDSFTATGHGMETGLKVVITSTDTVPSTLISGTTYYVVKVDDDTFKLAADLSAALDGAGLLLLDQGVGTHTITPASLAGCTVKLQANTGDTDDSSWFDIPDSEVSITGDGSQSYNVREQFYTKMRVYVTLTAGQISMTGFVSGKGW